MTNDASRELPSDLLLLQGWIWVHSLLWSALGLAFFWALFLRQDLTLAVGILVCGLIWVAGFIPLMEKADNLRPDQRVAATGLPVWLLLLWGAAEILGWTPGARRDLAALLICAHLLFGGTILMRGFITVNLDVPMHRRTWGASLAILGVGCTGQRIASLRGIGF